MTYIHSNKRNSLLNRIIAGLICGLLLGTFGLIALYNNVVNLNHNVATAKSSLDAIGAKNSALNNQVVADLGNIQSGNLAQEDNLVADNHPQYFETNQSWPIASQQ